MGMCKSKTAGLETGGEGGGMMSKLKEMAFSMMVKSGGGAENQGQLASLKKMVTSKFPKANIQEEVDPKAGEETFDITMDGQKVHSKATDGKIEDNKDGIMAKVKEILMAKLKTAF